LMNELHVRKSQTNTAATEKSEFQALPVKRVAEQLKDQAMKPRGVKTAAASVADDLMQFTSPLASTVKINNLQLP
jgi:hypothetical protein